MNFNIDDFIQGIPAGISKQELGTRIYEEVRAAENMKVGYLDQASENPEFYVNISRQLDTYINYLKMLHNRVSPTPIAPDQELFPAQQPEIEKIMKLIDRITKAEQNRISGSQDS